MDMHIVRGVFASQISKNMEAIFKSYQKHHGVSYDSFLKILLDHISKSCVWSTEIGRIYAKEFKEAQNTDLTINDANFKKMLQYHTKVKELNKTLTGVTAPSLPVIIGFADFFKISISDLLHDLSTEDIEKITTNKLDTPSQDESEPILKIMKQIFGSNSHYKYSFKDTPPTFFSKNNNKTYACNCTHQALNTGIPGISPVQHFDLAFEVKNDGLCYIDATLSKNTSGYEVKYRGFAIELISQVGGQRIVWCFLQCEKSEVAREFSQTHADLTFICFGALTEEKNNIRVGYMMGQNSRLFEPAIYKALIYDKEIHLLRSVEKINEIEPTPEFLMYFDSFLKVDGNTDVYVFSDCFDATKRYIEDRRDNNTSKPSDKYNNDIKFYNELDQHFRNFDDDGYETLYRVFKTSFTAGLDVSTYNISLNMPPTANEDEKLKCGLLFAWFKRHSISATHNTLNPLYTTFVKSISKWLKELNK